MSRKIFFADLDGTLLNDKKEITPKTRAALDDFVAAGNYFVVNTGRALDSAKAVREQYDLYYPHMFLAGCMGAEIYSCDEQRVVFRQGVDLADVRTIAQMAIRRNIYLQTYTDTHIISPGEHPSLEYYCRAVHTPVLIFPDIREGLTEDPPKLIAVELEDYTKLQGLREEITEAFGEKYRMLRSNPRFLEVFSAKVNKGTAIAQICSYLDIPVEDSISAGDEENDIDMIKAAGVGIGMCNGIQAVRDCADIITETDNNNDGLAPILRRLL